MDSQEAYNFLIDCLRSPRKNNYGNYQADIDISHVAINFVKKKTDHQLGSYSGDDPLVVKQLPYLQDAAWQLCLKGVLRPGVNNQKQMSNNGLIFSLTTQGRVWLEKTENDFSNTSPSHFSQILMQYNEEFGEGFRQRSQEACHAYISGCYLATCVLCGAAAESIMLKLAISKNTELSEESILKKYTSANGTKKIYDMVAGPLKEHLKSRLDQLNELLKYHRDVSGHGESVEISEYHAYDSISRLIRLSQFIKDHYDDIIPQKNK